jgi:Holliday junction resolvasome RuvABC endonuclease subunit
MTIDRVELIEREISMVEHLAAGAITRKAQIALNKRLNLLEQELAELTAETPYSDCVD